jgi:hypothetical protein
MTGKLVSPVRSEVFDPMCSPEMRRRIVGAISRHQ